MRGYTLALVKPYTLLICIFNMLISLTFLCLSFSLDCEYSWWNYTW